MLETMLYVLFIIYLILALFYLTYEWFDLRRSQKEMDNLMEQWKEQLERDLKALDDTEEE